MYLHIYIAYFCVFIKMCCYCILELGIWKTELYIVLMITDGIIQLTFFLKRIIRDEMVYSNFIIFLELLASTGFLLKFLKYEMILSSAIKSMFASRNFISWRCKLECIIYDSNYILMNRSLSCYSALWTTQKVQRKAYERINAMLVNSDILLVKPYWCYVLSLCI